MKSLFRVFTLIFLVTVNFSCRTQKLMRTLSDAGRLEENEQVFVDKPLKTLLKEIKPKIKRVSVDGQRADGGVSIIIFRFTDWEERKKYNLAGKTPLSIVVRIKERFEWNKPRTEIFTWTEADAKKFGNLTVASVGVVGEPL